MTIYLLDNNERYDRSVFAVQTDKSKAEIEAYVTVIREACGYDNLELVGTCDWHRAPMTWGDFQNRVEHLTYDLTHDYWKWQEAAEKVGQDVLAVAGFPCPPTPSKEEVEARFRRLLRERDEAMAHKAWR